MESLFYLNKKFKNIKTLKHYKSQNDKQDNERASDYTLVNKVFSLEIQVHKVNIPL